LDVQTLDQFDPYKAQQVAGSPESSANPTASGPPTATQATQGAAAATTTVGDLVF